MIALLQLVGCTVFPAPDASPTASFDALWADFDAHYGGFVVRPDLDWDEAYDTLRPEVRDDMTDAELLAVMQDLLRPLNDDHVFLFDFKGDFWSSYTPAREEEELDLPFIRDTLLRDPVDERSLVWGWLEEGIGYIFIRDFSTLGSVGELSQALETFANADGVVVDIRDSPGGTDSIAAELAGCFATEPQPFLTIRIRNGPARDDFSEPIRWSLEPADCGYTGPVALVTNTRTVSAGESFTLAMTELPQVVHVGETTTGSFSDVVTRDLPNGWLYSLSIGDWRDARDVSHEGIGIIPTIEAINTLEALSEGRDLALEGAVNALLR
ncbi:MAG: S41 family peptidase [Myxococcota bacterium]